MIFVGSGAIHAREENPRIWPDDRRAGVGGVPARPQTSCSNAAELGGIDEGGPYRLWPQTRAHIGIGTRLAANDVALGRFVPVRP